MFEKKDQYDKYNVSLSISYMEIYKDDVYDLLVPRDNVRRVVSTNAVVDILWFKAPKLPVRENDAGMVFVANLSLETISSVEEFDAIYKCVSCSQISLFRRWAIWQSSHEEPLRWSNKLKSLIFSLACCPNNWG